MLAIEIHTKLVKVYLEASGAQEETFRGLRVVQATMSDGHARRPNGKLPNIKLTTRTVPNLGSLVHKL